MIKYAYYKIKYGILEIRYDEKIIVKISIVKKLNNTNLKNDLTDRVFKEINEYLLGKRKNFNIPFKLVGTDFQKKVWNELLRIPYGETRTYKDIARNIGNEKASRAVGMACNKNSIVIIVPCHRVISSSGNLTGYAYGLEMKKDLLEMEKNNNLIDENY